VNQNTLEDATFKRDFSFIGGNLEEEDLDGDVLSANYSESLCTSQTGDHTVHRRLTDIY
jgi:hypothetical protein